MRNPFLWLIAVTALSSGCTMMEYAKPHQLWKLNRQPAPMGESGDVYFSIPAQPQSKSPEKSSFLTST